MKTILAIAFFLAALGGTPVPGASPFENPAAYVPENQIDKIVFARLQQLGIQPALVCSDAVFIRRAYFDIIGTLPTAAEVRDFLQNRAPLKRTVLIDQLLARDEFVDYWSMKWSDLLRVKAEFPINLWPNAVQGYHRWIHTAVRQNMPYDRFVRELLTGSGSNFRESQVNFYRATQNKEPQGLAQAVALTFMGVRAENWPSNQLAGLTAFFSQIGFKHTLEWKEEIIYFDPGLATNNLWQAARFPDGTPAKLTPDRDPREVFADWLIDPKNPWFTRHQHQRTPATGR